MQDIKSSMEVRGSIEPFTIVKDVVSQWLIILLLSVSISLLAYIAVDMTYVPEYTASGTYVVSQKSDTYAYGNLSAAQQTAEQLTKILESSILQKKVCEDLSLLTFSGIATTSVIPETNIITVSMTAGSPELAWKLLNSTMENYPLVSEYLLGDIVIEVLEEPVVPMGPSNYIDAQTPKDQAFKLTALVLIAFFAVMSYLRDTVRTEKDAKNKVDAPFMGTIYHENRFKTLKDKIRRPKGSILVTNATSSFCYVETMRKIVMKVKNKMDENGDKVLLVSSVQENEGKSTVAANIALVLAQESEKVVLLDCDFRKPAQFKLFDRQKENLVELGEVLCGRHEGSDIIGYDEKNGIYYLMGSRMYPDSTEMIGTGRLESLICYLKENMDYVIIDTSPMALVPDAEELAEMADASLLVVRQHRADVLEINDAIDALEGSSHFVGFVLNNLIDTMSMFSQIGNGSGYGSSYGYGYGSGYGYGRYGGSHGKKDRR